MATEITAEQIQDKLISQRRKLGISETGIPTQSITRLQNSNLTKDWKPFSNVEEIYYPCGERRDYQFCKVADKLEGIYKQAANPEKYLALWQVPKKYLHSSFDNFQGGESVKKICQERVKKQEDVLLTGQTGCGKTHLAVSMMREFIVKSTVKFDDGTAVFFITVPELLLEIRQSFNNPNTSEGSVVEKYSRAPFLILDDLGAEKTTEWAESTLYLIIDRRNRNMKWTIVTTNLSLKEIENNLGARIASRLSDMKIINIKLPDYRKKRV